jgi:hypothetical protein
MYCAVQKHSTAGDTAGTPWPAVYLLSVPQLLTVARSKAQWTQSEFQAFCTVYLFSIRNKKPTDVTVSILFVY